MNAHRHGSSQAVSTPTGQVPTSGVRGREPRPSSHQPGL